MVFEQVFLQVIRLSPVSIVLLMLQTHFILLTALTRSTSSRNLGKFK